MTVDDVVLVYDGQRVRFLPAPPDWWWDLQDALEEAEAPRTSEPYKRRTACRPGIGPCRRRHEHATERRAA